MFLFIIILCGIFIYLYQKQKQNNIELSNQLRYLEKQIQQINTLVKNQVNSLVQARPPNPFAEFFKEKEEIAKKIEADRKAEQAAKAPSPPKQQMQVDSISLPSALPSPQHQPLTDQPKPSPSPSSESRNQEKAQYKTREKLYTFLKNVDWEQFTGTKLFAWLGGIAAFICTGFFAKYSIDKGLIPLEIRLALSAIFGLGLVVSAFFPDKKKYDILRQSLTACGIGILYSICFAITLYYQMIPKLAGFTLICIISTTAFVLAVFHRGVFLSILGALGAYLTPILVSTGQGNLLMLFLYLCVVNIGLWQVNMRLASPWITISAICGTSFILFLGSFFGTHIKGPIVALVWIFHSFIASVYLTKYALPHKFRRDLFSGTFIHLAALTTAFILLDRAGMSSMLCFTFCYFSAHVLAHYHRAWYNQIIPYAMINFIGTLFWVVTHFNSGEPSWDMLILFIYGIAAGLGPFILIRKYGLSPSIIKWLRFFPILFLAMGLIILIENSIVSFWFWPMIISIQIIGLLISLILGSILQFIILFSLVIIEGLYWIFHIPAHTIHIFVFLFLFVWVFALCALLFFALRALPLFADKLRISTPDTIDAKHPLTGFIAAAPCLGAFILLASLFAIQRPIFPHPGMAVWVCILSICVFLGKRLSFQPLICTAICAAICAQGVWVFWPDSPAHVQYYILGWASPLFILGLVLPFVFFPLQDKWTYVWMAWGFFELGQGLFIIWAGDHLWPRAYSGCLPLGLFFLKQPFIISLLNKLKDKKNRNSILAVHGGTLLFYASAMPVLLLSKGWMGVSLVIEASALLWLNTRIPHPGLRWTAFFMAPIGLMYGITYIQQLKSLGQTPILNGATISMVICCIALSQAVRFAKFPLKKLYKIDLPNFFLWLFVGTGFYLVNLIVADIFSPTSTRVLFLSKGNFSQSLCYTVVWSVFGAVLWRIANLPKGLKLVGLGLLSIGFTKLLYFPFLHPLAITTMALFFNGALLAYVVMIAIFYGLYITEPKDFWNGVSKNVFLSAILMIVFFALLFETSSVLQPDVPMAFIFSSSWKVSIARAFVWMIYGLAILVWPKALEREFRLAGFILLIVALFQTVVWPFAFASDFGKMTPILNFPTAQFILSIGVLVYLSLKKNTNYWPVPQINGQIFWGIFLAVLCFFVLNVEISSAFSTEGRRFSFFTHGNLAHQLGYSIGWLVFSIALLSVGIRKRIVQVRWAALIGFVITAIKIFIWDLWSLGQGYRIIAFAVLAAFLLLVSFLYQKIFAKGQ